MFLARINPSQRNNGSPDTRPAEWSFLDQVRHLRQDGRWHEVATPGCRLVCCTGPGVSPVVSEGENGSWLLSFGTPSTAAHGIITRPGQHDRLSGFLDQGEFPDWRQLGGTFVLAGYHQPTRSLELITDRSGVTPLYILEDEGGLWASSSALAIACVAPVKVSPEGLACLLGNEFPLRHWSIFAGINRVLPGRKITYCDARLVNEFWWRPDCESLSPFNIDDLAEQIATETPSALEKRYQGERKVICSLTGGLDSRCMGALLARSKVEASFFTFDTGPAYETALSRELASILALEWTQLSEDLTFAQYRTVTEQSAILCDGESHPFRGTSYWSPVLGGSDKTILWGFGGEIWRDYWSKHEKAALLLQGKDAIERLVRHRTYGCGIGDDALNPDYRVGMRLFVTEQYRHSFSEMPADNKLDKLDMLYITERLRRWASIHMNTTGWWAIPDAPLMSPDLLELAFRLPRSAKKSSALMRAVIYHTNSMASQLPHNGGYHSLPPGLATSKEQLHSLALDGRHLASRLPLLSRVIKKEKPVKPPRMSSWTYQQMFGEYLDSSGMKSAPLFHEPNLIALIENSAHRPIGQSRPLDFLIGLEMTLRAAKRLVI